MRPTRRLVAVVLATFALLIGGAAAWAVTGQTTATYTYTVPGTTVAIPAQTYTQTVAIPTVTETVTQTVTVAAPTTTTSNAPTYASETAYTQEPPAFTAQRDVPVASQSQLSAALSSLKCGDNVHATATFTVTGQFGISANPTCAAVIDLHGVSFVGSSSAYAAVWMHAASNLRLYGGDLSNPYDYGIEVNGGTHDVLWWGFTVHDVGTTGLAAFPNGGDITRLDFAGEISRWNGNPSLDPHAEKGTGNHGANLGDMSGSTVFSDNRFALDVHDGPGGAGVEIGDPDTSSVTGNTLYLRARHLTMVATQQVAGNALELWGAAAVGLHIPYLEASDLTGRAVDETGVYSGTSMAGVSVDYGRATNVEQNPLVAGQPIWDASHGVVYGDVG